MDNNYRSISPTSYQYRYLAQKIADLCPISFAREIALTGSAARGIADEDSDIELNCWIDNIPSVLERKQWLKDIGATEIIFNNKPISDGSLWTACLFENTWVEIGWQAELAQEELLEAILKGAVLDSGRLVIAGLIDQAIILRTKGLLPKWQQRLAHYPEHLTTKLIVELVESWKYPHLVSMRWALVKRKQRFALTQKLTQDINNVLRILFALNNKWETNTKWLDRVADQMPIKPLKLAERINEIFSGLSLDEKVFAVLELIIETLKLLPPLAEVKQAIITLENNLFKGLKS